MSEELQTRVQRGMKLLVHGVRRKHGDQNTNPQPESPTNPV